MPKGILEFTLPEEDEEFKNASNGIVYKLILSDMDNYLRSRLKHEELSEPVREVLQAVRDKFWELLNEENVKI